MSEPLRIGRCPTCSRTSRLDPQNRWRPFCSERCKLVDLGDWFEGRHRLPGAPVDPLESDADPLDGDGSR